MGRVERRNALCDEIARSKRTEKTVCLLKRREQEMDHKSTHSDLYEVAMRLARECRGIIQACLREEEWLDAEEEFRWVILAGLNEVAKEVSCADGQRGGS